MIVSDEPSSLIINTPGTENGALSPNAITDVVFSVQIHGIELNNILNVEINGINSSNSLFLNDSGQNGDLVADDGAYSGILTVNTDGFLPQQCLTYEAVATTSNESFTSLPYDLCVTAFPIGFQASDTSESNLIPDPETGDPAIADEMMVGFNAGTSESTIISIVSSVNGQVVGSLIELGIYQVKLDSPAASSGELATIIATLAAFPEVEFAEANGIDQGTTVVPTDSRFIDQNGIKKIRADEAWYIARGNVTVAIVDSGADLTHPDLNAKIIKGTDFVNGGDPDDEHGHGTHVAGIAAAETGNSTGIAGVSWASQVLVVRVLDQNNSGTFARTVQGIKYAADKGSRIINVSLGGTGGRLTKCAAVTYAIGKGSLVIAAAGNNGNSTRFYPAACPGAIAVGNTTSSDGRANLSNFGPWVDLAAPGTQILSTVPITGSCTHCTTSGYKRLTGTSMASPMVAGAAAVLLSREPSLTNAKIEERLKKTAKKLPGLNLGAGRIDLFEAVFNGSFEEGNLALWQKNGTVASFDKLGPLNPQDRERMGYVSTGPAAAQTAGSLAQSFTVQAGVTALPITFTYAFISEEFPEFVGTEFNDSLKISLRAPDGTITELATETINSSSYSAISGLDFPGGDGTVGWTGWKTVTKEVPVTAGAGEYQIILEDAGDAIYDTVLLIDHIQFKP